MSRGIPFAIKYGLRNLFIRDVIFTKCYARFKGVSIIANNWGDDINKYFFEFVSNKKMAVMPSNAELPFRITYYSLIGSTLSHMNNCIIYGTGLMTESSKLHGRPKKIISVRGPLTRKALISKGYSCPEHYGDPALLLPLFYKPDMTKKYNLSIIPNEGSYWKFNPVIEELINEYGCNLINMTKYEKWTDIIDAIAESKFIISESLHGLIVAETYNIPSVWVEFTDHKNFNDDWGFKFRDFYESIGKYNMQSIKLFEGFDFESLIKLKELWQRGTIDYERLLKYFPFEIKSKFFPSH